MNYITDDKPIVACSTGLSENTAIGVIRLSGFPDLNYLKQFFKIKISEIEERKATFCNLYFKDTLLDEVVITFFKGPRSYNGENILEISAHGNIFNLKKIIMSFVESGLFRLANQGEFTYRALLNKKLSLSQVEGLDALLNASSALMLEQGLDLLNGKLHNKYRELHKSYLKLKSAIEMNIDFMEDIGEEESDKLLNDSLSKLGEIINNLSRSASVSTKSLLSPDIVLAGEPNAGKSSLFNLILNNSRSIVSDIAGTTRDFITEYISIDNNSFRLVDTAGLRNTTDIIEEEGIKRSVDLLDESFFRILLVNVNEAEKFNFASIINKKFDLILFTHIDNFKDDFDYNKLTKRLPTAQYYICCNSSKATNNSGPIGALKNGSIEPVSYEFFGPKVRTSLEKSNGPMGPVGFENNIGPIEPVSFENNNGPIEPVGFDKNGGPIEPVGFEENDGPIEPEIRKSSSSLISRNTIASGPIGAANNISFISEEFDIVDQINQLISKKFQQLRSEDPIIIERHRTKIQEISRVYSEFLSNINDIGDIGIISSEARIIESKISELIGIVSPDDVLNNIFSNFCIGK